MLTVLGRDAYRAIVREMRSLGDVAQEVNDDVSPGHRCASVTGTLPLDATLDVLMTWVRFAHCPQATVMLQSGATSISAIVLVRGELE